MLRLPLHLTHNVLSHSIVVFDVTNTRDSLGRPIQTQGANRNIVGNLQPAGDKVIKLLPEGAQAEGAKVLHTTAPVYVADNRNGGGETRQTYIRDNGDLLKVRSLQDWSIHSPIGKWFAEKYVDESGQIS